MKKRQSAARRCVQNGVQAKNIFLISTGKAKLFLKRRRNHWPSDFLDLKKDVKLSKIHNKYRNTKKSRLFSTGLSYKRWLFVTAI